MIRACSIVHDAVGRPDPRRATHPAAGRCYWCAAPIVERACKVSDVITDSFTDQDQALARRWVCSIADSGQIHTLPFAPVNACGGSFGVRFERVTIHTTAETYRRIDDSITGSPAGPLDPDAPLPWDFIVQHYDKPTLRRAYDAMMRRLAE